MAEHSLTLEDAKLLINSLTLPYEKFKPVFINIAKRNGLWEASDQQIEQIQRLLCRGLLEMIISPVGAVEQHN